MTMAWLDGRMKRPPAPVSPDADAVYETVHTVDVTGLEPMVALPHDPSNTHPVSEVAELGLTIDQAFLGSCTNARVEDIAVAAQILAGRSVHPDVRMIVTPASSEVWKECARLGLLGRAGRGRGDDHQPRLRGVRRGPPRAARSTASGASRRPTATSRVAWAAPTPRSAWRHRRPSRHRRSPGASPIPGRTWTPPMAEAATLVRRGRAWSFGNDISTDLIMPGAILWGHVKGADARKAAIMPNRPGWAERDVRPGDLVVAGTNFGCGSSRPAPRVLRDELGLSCVVAESFSRLFQRNAVNIGFPVLICPGITDVRRRGRRARGPLRQRAGAQRDAGRRAVRRALPARQPARPAAADGRPAPVPRAVARGPPRGPRRRTEHALCHRTSPRGLVR